MLTCHEIIQVVYQYLDKDMKEGQIVEVRQHLELCRHCFSRVEFEDLLRVKLRGKTEHCCPDRLKKRIQDLLELF